MIGDICVAQNNNHIQTHFLSEANEKPKGKHEFIAVTTNVVRNCISVNTEQQDRQQSAQYTVKPYFIYLFI